jgi:DNA-binding MarR family transcriptional regulator
MMGLTEKQRACLDAITTYYAAKRIMPSVSELCVALARPRGTVFRLLAGLEKRGAITRIRYRPRAISLVVETCPHCGKNLQAPRRDPGRVA